MAPIIIPIFFGLIITFIAVIALLILSNKAKADKILKDSKPIGELQIKFGDKNKEIPFHFNLEEDEKYIIFDFKTVSEVTKSMFEFENFMTVVNTLTENGIKNALEFQRIQKSGDLTKDLDIESFNLPIIKVILEDVRNNKKYYRYLPNTDFSGYNDLTYGSSNSFEKTHHRKLKNIEKSETKSGIIWNISDFAKPGHYTITFVLGNFDIDFKGSIKQDILDYKMVIRKA